MELSEPEVDALLSGLSSEEREALQAEVDKVLAGFALENYKPQPKQAEFHRAGGDEGVFDRLLMAGNQLGKTHGGGYEVAMHLTGQYPEGWDGCRFLHAIRAWAASETGEGTRDSVQRMLLGGAPGSAEWGTGAIPRNCIGTWKRANGTPDLVDYVRIKHVDGKWSLLKFKTYDQGRKRWQAETLNLVWFDEEPPEDIFSEGKTRTNAVSGITIMTFTPLQGMSAVVKRFLQEKPPGSHVTRMSIWDSTRYTEEEKKRIVADYPAHLREARANGIPTLGSGRIFPVEDAAVKEQMFKIPSHFKRLASIDFGWDHPAALVWGAYDVENDIVHIYDCWRARETTPAVQYATYRAKGDWIPVAWPHDGHQHDKGSGEALKAQYSALGFKMLPKHATHAPDPKASPPQKEGEGGNSVEAGLLDMLDRMMTGRFKVAAHLNDWFEEFRLYHRDDGKIVKVDDDLMAATRYLCMMLRHAAFPKVERTTTLPTYSNPTPGMGVLG